MSGITGLGTTYTLPNYTGELMNLSPSETPILNLAGTIGGSGAGAGQTTSTEFEWTTSDLRANAQNTSLEGADAPTSQERVRANVTNVVQIHQSKVGVSYTKLAAIGLKAGSNNTAPSNVTSELDWQLRQELISMGRDVEWSCLLGRYNKPSDNTTARKTRGLFQAITTNAISKAVTTLTGATSATNTITSTAHGLSDGDKVVFTTMGTLAAHVVEANRVYYVVSSATNTFGVALTSGGTAITLGTATGIGIIEPWATTLTVDHINDLFQTMWDNGGLRGGGPLVVLANSTQKRAITTAYGNAFTKAVPVQGKVGGLNVMQIETDFGTASIVLHDMMPRDAFMGLTADELRTVFLDIPGKGHFFAEPLAKTGASEYVQLYGEVGLAYGAESHHGYLRGLAV